MTRKTFSGAQLAYIRKKTRRPDLDPSEMAGELNIIPFLDIVMNLIIFLLATSQAVLLISQIESNLPKLARGTRPAGSIETPLNLNVTVTESGVMVVGSGGSLLAGCEQTGSGTIITVPKQGMAYDWKGLTTCVARVKQEFPKETRVTVSANPEIYYEHVIAAMDAVREQDRKLLFPDVMISVGVR